MKLLLTRSASFRKVTLVSVADEENKNAPWIWCIFVL